MKKLSIGQQLRRSLVLQLGHSCLYWNGSFSREVAMECGEECLHLQAKAFFLRKLLLKTVPTILVTSRKEHKEGSVLFFSSNSVSTLQYLIQLREAWNVVARLSKGKEIKEEKRTLQNLRLIRTSLSVNWFMEDLSCWEALGLVPFIRGQPCTSWEGPQTHQSLREQGPVSLYICVRVLVSFLWTYLFSPGERKSTFLQGNHTFPQACSHRYRW